MTLSPGITESGLLMLFFGGHRKEQKITVTLKAKISETYLPQIRDAKCKGGDRSRTKRMLKLHTVLCCSFHSLPCLKFKFHYE